MLKKLLNANLGLKFLSFLSIGLILMLFANYAFFKHTHVLDNGNIITHAHPYTQESSDDPQPKHDHTKGELIFLSGLSLLLQSFVLSATFQLETTDLLFSAEKAQTYNPQLISSFQGRAPPSYPLSSLSQ